jgi:predicted ATPase
VEDRGDFADWKTNPLLQNTLASFQPKNVLIVCIFVQMAGTMAQEKLIVKNFGPIREAELDLGKVTVFIGEQASGKSVLAKLVAIMNNYDFLAKKNIQKRLSDFKIENFLNINSELHFVSDGYIVKYSNEELEINFVDSVRKELIEELVTTKDVLGLMYNDVLDNGSESSLIKDYEWLSNRLDQLLINIQKKFSNPVYIPTERILISLLSNALFTLARSPKTSTIPDFILEFGNNFQISKIGYKSGNINIFDLKYKFENQNDILTLQNDIKLNLSEASSGYQSGIPMYLVIESQSENGNQFFIVEEPELNLYPTTQKKLVEYLAGKTDNNTLILTTHSPYILSSLDNLIQAGNVARKYPELKAEVEKIVPAQYHLNYEEVKVYFVADGTARLIMNEEYQGIDVNELDVVSENLNEEFEKLLDLKYQH